MALRYILCVLVWMLVTCVVCDETGKNSQPEQSDREITTHKPTAQPVLATTNSTRNESGTYKGFYDRVIENKGMLMRAFYVLLAVTSIVVVYFGIKAWRMRRRKNKSRKYGLISQAADLEMEPLDCDDDDEEDMTVFERRK